jgi:cytoskeletal protein RodZ
MADDIAFIKTHLETQRKTTLIFIGVLAVILILSGVFIWKAFDKIPQYDETKQIQLETQYAEIQKERADIKAEREEIISTASRRLDSAMAVISSKISGFDQKISNIKNETHAKVTTVRNYTSPELDKYFSGLTEDYIHD